MDARVLARTESGFTLQVEIRFQDSMLDAEDALQDALNRAGVLATTEILQHFDSDGKPITVAGSKMTSKGQLPKDYQTPYGVATVKRHVYQSSRGGKTFCPLDQAARIVVSSTGGTPRNGQNRTLRAYEGAGGKPSRHSALETQRLRAISPCLRAWRETNVFRHTDRRLESQNRVEQATFAL